MSIYKGNKLVAGGVVDTPVVVDKVETGNMYPVTSNAVYNALNTENTKNIVIKAYNDIECDLFYQSQPSVAPLSPTGYYVATGLKIDYTKVAVVLAQQKCVDSEGRILEPFVPYSISTYVDGSLMFRFLNISNNTKECAKCRVWLWLIGRPEDMPN